MDELNWSDIGYNFIICSDNKGQQKIYKGRGWNFMGSNCKGYKSKSLSKKVYFHSSE